MNPLSYRPPRFLRCLVAALVFAAGTLPARADELMRQVQEELRRRNLYFGDVNGLKSPQVAAALRRYQQRKGFQATGEADNTTLQSLSLSSGELTVAISGAASPTPTAAEATPLPGMMVGVAGVAGPWPDVPVLRSDLGSENAEPPAGVEPVEPTPTPPLRPPPAAAFQRGAPDEGNLRGFVENFLKSGESNAPDAQMQFFADHVDYFDDGKVNKAFIVKDTERYNKRWPTRRFTLDSPLQVTGELDQPPGTLVVNFRYQFDVKQSEHEGKDPKEVKGEVENTYTLVRTGPDSLRIVAIKERRVRR